MPDGNTSFGRF